MKDYKKGNLPKKHFSKERLNYLREHTNLADFFSWYAPDSVIKWDGSYRLASNHSVVLNGIWYRDFAAPESNVPGKKNPVCGIDAVMQHFDLNFYQAVHAVNDFTNEHLSSAFPPIESLLTVEKLAEHIKNGTYIPFDGNINAWAYLERTRKIPAEIIRAYNKEKLLYVEPLENGVNLLFARYDPEDGKTILGFERCGVLSNKENRFKGCISASPNSVFWRVLSPKESSSPPIHEVYVFESAIDVMSFEAMVQAGLIYIPSDRYAELISLGGLKPNSLKKYLEHSQPNGEVILCVDADKAGDIFEEKVLDYMGERGACSKRYILTEHGTKDWNELLKSGKLSAPAVPSNDSMHENLDELLDDPDGELPF